MNDLSTVYYINYLFLFELDSNMNWTEQWNLRHSRLK